MAQLLGILVAHRVAWRDVVRLARGGRGCRWCGRCVGRVVVVAAEGHAGLEVDGRRRVEPVGRRQGGADGVRGVARGLAAHRGNERGLRRRQAFEARHRTVAIVGRAGRSQRRRCPARGRARRGRERRVHVARGVVEVVAHGHREVALAFGEQLLELGPAGERGEAGEQGGGDEAMACAHGSVYSEGGWSQRAQPMTRLACGASRRASGASSARVSEARASR